MSLSDDLKNAVAETFRELWQLRDGRVVPDTADVQLGNHGVQIDATVLYADLSGSTQMVDSKKPQFSAEIYKSYLYCAARILKGCGGTITAYDGDRIMAVFLGDAKCSSAVDAGLKINHAVADIINPTLKALYPKTTFRVRHTVGIDTSSLLVARTGVRGSNDLVFVGRAANYAAKLTSLSPDYPTRVTSEVYSKMNKGAKYSSKGDLMWESARWTDMGNVTIYRSTWWRSVNMERP